MGELPSATTRLNDESGGLATGTDLLAIWAPVPTNADEVPRVYASSQSIYDTHGYSPGLDLGALFMQIAKKPVVFLGLTIETPGVVGRKDTSGNSGTCVVDVTVGGSGSLEECDGILKVTNGGTKGTDQILLSLSLDGGRSYQPLRLGTAASKVIPYVGQTLSFAAGTLIAGDTVLTWHSTAPQAGATGIAAAKTALAAQTKQHRSWILCSEISVSGDVTAIKSAVDTFETSDERYSLVKLCLRDRLPQATMSKVTVGMTGSPSLTFAEVAAVGDTITRSAGSFVADGFVAGDRVTVTGSAGNNITDALVTDVAALVLTLDTEDLSDEGPVADCVLTGTPGITFAEVGGVGDTITRNRGSWLADGFRVGDNFTITGTASNDITTTAGIDTVTATVITLDTDDLAAEAIGSNLINIVGGETWAQAVAALDSAMAAVADDKRLDKGFGRAAMISPIHAWKLRRPVQWRDTIESYVRDIRTTTWHKEKGPLSNFDLNGPDGQPCEYDERTIGGALAARFTCARTWGNGPEGGFIAQSLTRAPDGSILGMTHNMHIANLGQKVVQLTTENFAGATLELQKADAEGKRVATAASLAEFESKVNEELVRYLLSNIGGEGKRASVATWTAATDDDLGVADATMHGTLNLELNGTLVHISTVVKVT